MRDTSGWLVELPIAHRGLYDEAAGRPANSLAAFDAAAGAGYPSELDIHLTAAGELVVIHDYELSALTGVAVRTAELTPQRRRTLRLCGTDEPVPTLADVLACVAGRAPLLLELKRPRVRYASRLVASVLDQLSSYRGEYALASFDPLVVWALHRARPGVPVGQISGLLRGAGAVGRVIGRAMLTNVVTRPDFLSYELAGLPVPAVTRARERGVPVVAWPVLSPEDEKRARRYADNVIFSHYLPPLRPEGTPDDLTPERGPR